MSEVMEHTGTDLIVSGAITAVVAFAPGAPAKLLEKIEREAREKAALMDASTEAGRKARSSLALKVAKTKTAYDGMGKDLVEDWKAQAKVIDAERRAIRERLDALRDEIEAPVEAFKQRERDRVAGHEAAIKEIADLTIYATGTATSSEIRCKLDEAEALHSVRDWQEFAGRADDVRSTAIKYLTNDLAAAIKREAEAAELAACRAKQAEEARLEAIRAQEARERQIATEAAELARKEAERKAEAEREAIQNAAREAEQKAKADLEAAEWRIRKEQEIAERAEAARIAAAEKAERDRIDAAERAERDRIAAVEAERQREADAKAAAAAEEKRRADDKAHRGAIAKGVVRHISVRY